MSTKAHRPSARRSLAVVAVLASLASLLSLAFVSLAAAPSGASTQVVAAWTGTLSCSGWATHAVPADAINGKEDAEVLLKFPNGELKFAGRDYLLGFVHPNFYFHVTTAYALLRMKGVPIGKMDFLGGA
jgi:hypothetical protein